MMATRQFIEEVSHTITLDQCILAAAALILYDYTLTFSTEVEVIWRKQMTNATSILFLVNRYNSLFQAIMGVCFVGAQFPTNLSCKFLLAFSQISDLLSFAAWAVFSALRVYTINNRNIFLAAVALGFGLVPFATNLLYTVKKLSAPSFFGGNHCNTKYVPPDDASDRSVLVTLSEHSTE
ncbi:hypothetical protein CERSUDRAFT_89363 [Gelatoporia subvermispora B]|uniref:DUF6533 domain-containing protein n=1 Tax=Ceriporiopsis subvermispora (strain B) TaxID=914234 RepID=M2QXD6_CERS8|nr:hypothetical protein CERSUDRAFT_89363 [Gelatoporia subvermispora B]